MRKRDWLLAYCSLFATGCTLAGIGEFDIGACDEAKAEVRSACRVLDERDGIGDEACLHWQCSRTGRGCELRAKDYDADDHADAQVCGGMVDRADDCDDENAKRHRSHPEEPDGIDNDCDDIIDNRSLAPCVDPVEVLDVVLPPARGDLELRRVRGTSGLLTATRNGYAAIVDPAEHRSAPITFDSQAAVAQSGMKPCPTPGGNQACNARDLSLASLGETVIGAVVSDNAGCPQGEVRVGVGTASNAPISLWFGSSDRHESNITSAIDRTDDRCPELGARRPAIVGISDATRAQALSAWLEGDPRSALACGEDVAVRAIGLWIAPADPSVVRATGDGRSQEIGRTHGGGAPAVLGDANGYIVGFGNPAGQLELHLFAPLSSTDSEEEPTPPLKVSPPYTFIQGGDVNFVALEFGNTQQRMAAAFRTSCGAQSEIAVFVFSLEGDRPQIIEEFATVALKSESSAVIVDGPELVYVSTGFRVSERSRASLGGWIVSWIVSIEGTTELLAARVSDDGVLLDESPFLVASGEFDRAVGSAVDARVSYVGSKSSRDVLEHTTVFCPPR